MSEEKSKSRPSSPTRNNVSDETPPHPIPPHPIPPVRNSATRPIRAMITKIINLKEKLFKTSNDLFNKIDDTANPLLQTDLINIDQLIIKLSNLEQKIGKVPSYIENRFNLPKFINHPQMNEMKAEAEKEIERLDVDQTLMNIKKDVEMFKTELASHNYIISPPDEDVVLTEIEDDDLEVNRDQSLRNSSNYHSATFSIYNTNEIPNLENDLRAEVEKLKAELALKDENLKKAEQASKANEKVSKDLSETEKRSIIQSGRDDQEKTLEAIKKLVLGMSTLIDTNNETHTALMKELYNRENQKAQHSRATDNQSTEFIQPDIKNVYKLLIQFSGEENENFEFFHENFKENVLNNRNFSSQTKYLLLKQHVLSPASEFIQKSENFSEAVNQSLKELEIVFGREEDRFDLHETLLKLPFDQYDWEEMIKDLSKHRIIVRQLKMKNMNVDDERTIVPFLYKLSPSIKNELSKTTKKGLEKLTWKEVHDMVADCIDTIKARTKLDRRAVTTIHHSPNNDQYESEYYNPSSYDKKFEIKHSIATSTRFPEKFRIPETGEMVEGWYMPGAGNPDFQFLQHTFPYNQPEKGVLCIACSGPHKPMRCEFTSKQFRQAIRDKNLCAICLVRNHHTQQCKSNRKCTYCAGAHHSGGCPRKEYYRKVENCPNSAIVWNKPPINQFFREQRRQQPRMQGTSSQ